MSNNSYPNIYHYPKGLGSKKQQILLKISAGPKVETAQKLETRPQFPLLGKPKTGNDRSFHFWA